MPRLRFYIELYPQGDAWVADYTNAPPEQRASILDLFGGLVLPCAFSNAAPAEQVLATIQRLNPTQQVVLR